MSLGPAQLPNLDAISSDPDAEVILLPGQPEADAAVALYPAMLPTFIPSPNGTGPYTPADLQSLLEPLSSRHVVVWHSPDASSLADYLPAAIFLRPSPEPLTAPSWTRQRAETFLALERAHLADEYERARRNARPAPAAPPPDEPDHPTDAGIDPPSVEDWPFRILGYNEGIYFYLPFKTQQIVQLTATAHNCMNLLSLADIQWWEAVFPSKIGCNWRGASNALMRRCEMVGLFTGSALRGRGYWIDTLPGDPPRVVFHAGDRLLVGRDAHPIAGFESRYLYQRGEAVSTDDTPAAPAIEARKLIDLCDLLAWSSPLSGRLLAGWCCAATVCGALNWRPHIWLHGAPSTGKSWCLSNIVIPILGSFALKVQGASSEAGIRQKLQIDARPVVIDEAESEDEQGRNRLKTIMALARQSSTETGGVIVKGTTGGSAMEFNIRSAFCFSSTGYAPTQKADLSRITRLSLHLKPGQAERHAKCRAMWAETVGRPEFCAAIRNRIGGQAIQIRANATTFAHAIALQLGDQRVGDQLGAIIAGAYALASSSEVTPEQAKQWVMRQDWTEFQAHEVDRDENQALSLLLNAHIRIETGSTHETTSVDALASSYFAPEASQIDRDDAYNALLLYGLKLSDAGLHVHNSHAQLAKIFKDSPWSGKWKDQLARVPEAIEQSGTRFGSDRARSVFIPRSIFHQDAQAVTAAPTRSQDEDLPF